MRYQERNHRKILLALLLANGLQATFATTGANEERETPGYNVPQQKGRILGTVVDAKGDPVIGASVKVAGTKQGTITDANGVFRIQAPLGAKLTISSIGYETTTVPIDKTELKVTMNDNARQLGEVQVVAYGTQKKVTVTGAISSLDGDKLLQTSTGSISNILSGQVPGLQSVQWSGKPGADGATLYIRGMATFNDSSPLVQVDGVEQQNFDFNQMDPNEVESITVLKDASATAVFGVKGANGVILITTKRGQEGKTKINASTSVSFVVPTNIVKLANSYQYASYYNELNKNDGGTGKYFSDYVLQKFQDHSSPLLYPDIDWMDYAFKNFSLQTQHNLNISGGNNKFRYFISFGAFTQDGLLRQLAAPVDFGYKFKRYNYRANIDFQATKTTTISLNMGGYVGVKNQPYATDGEYFLFRSVYWSTPFSSPGIINGKYYLTATDYSSDPDKNLPFTGASGINGYYGKGYYSDISNTLVMNVSLVQKLDFITKGLSFTVKGSYNSYYNMDKWRGFSVATYTPVVSEDQNGTMNIEGYRKNGQDTQPAVSESTAKGRNWYMEASFNYNRAFGDHHVGALLLYNQSKYYYPGSYSDIPQGLVGLVGRVTYDWRNRYMAEFNIGYNGSENYAPGKRFGTFPAGSAGWIVSEEKFWEALKPAVSYFKLRASWGFVGNDRGAGRFLYTPDPYGLGGSYNFGTSNGYQNGAYEGGKHNAAITWEKSFKQDYGVDINFLNDRLQTTFDYFYEQRKDIMIVNYAAPGLLGFTPPYDNRGRVDSWGYEISAKWNDKIGKNVRYWVEANWNYNQNKIIEQMEAPQSYAYMMNKGHRIGSRYIRKFWGFYDDTAEARYKAQFGTGLPNQSITLKPGDVIYEDLNHDGKIDDNDNSEELGHTDYPVYTFGANIGFAWKNLTINTQWSAAWDVSRLLDGQFRQPLGDTGQKGLLLYQYENYWTPERGDNARYPRPSSLSSSNNYAASTLYEENSAYVRLKTMQVAYNLNLPFMKKLDMSYLTISLEGYNLFVISGFKWGDPEGDTSSYPGYPLTRSFTLSLKVGF